MAVGQGTNALAAVALLTVLGATVAVPAALGAVLPGEAPLRPPGVLDVGYGVSLTAPPVARLDVVESRPGAGSVTFLVKRVRVRVTAVTVPERSADFIAHTRHKFSRDEGLTPGRAQPWRLRSGLVGERGDLRAGDDSFGGDPGCYGAAVDEQVGVVVVVSPATGCTGVPAEIWNALDGLTIEPEEQP